MRTKHVFVARDLCRSCEVDSARKYLSVLTPNVSAMYVRCHVMHADLPMPVLHRNGILRMEISLRNSATFVMGSCCIQSGTQSLY